MYLTASVIKFNNSFVNLVFGAFTARLYVEELVDAETMLQSFSYVLYYLLIFFSQ